MRKTTRTYKHEQKKKKELTTTTKTQREAKKKKWLSQYNKNNDKKKTRIYPSWKTDPTQKTSNKWEEEKKNCKRE